MAMEEANIKDETELEAICKKDPEQIEKDLKVIDNQIPIPPTNMRLDLLCVDSKGVLTIVELKVNSDEHQMEQIIMYYDWALSNLDWIKNAYPKHKIKDETPRLILVAKTFPPKVVTLAKYISDVVTKVDLFTYKGIKVNEKKEIICVEFPLPPVPEIAEKPKTADEIEGYIKDEKVKKECNKVREYIKNIDIDNIEEAPTKYSITYKFKGRNLCSIDPRTGYFWMGWRHTDGSWKTEGDIKTFEEAKEIIDEDIKDFYNNLKQKR